jgi:hypothetical protein
LLVFLLVFLEGVAVMAARDEGELGVENVRDLRRLPPHR